MKIFIFLILIFLNAKASCWDFALLFAYEGKTQAQYQKGEGDIAKSIGELTAIINGEINKTETANLTKFKNLNSIKKEETLIKLKQNFLLKQNNELSGNINSIKGE